MACGTAGMLLKSAILWMCVTVICSQVTPETNPSAEDEEGPQPRILLSALAATALTSALLRQSYYPYAYGYGYPFYRPAVQPAAPAPAPQPAPPPAEQQFLDIPVVVDEFGNMYYSQTLPNGQTQIVYLPPEFLGRDGREKALIARRELEKLHLKNLENQEKQESAEKKNNLLFKGGSDDTSSDINQEIKEVLKPGEMKPVSTNTKPNNLLFKGSDGTQSQSVPEKGSVGISSSLKPGEMKVVQKPTQDQTNNLLFKKERK